MMRASRDGDLLCQNSVLCSCQLVKFDVDSAKQLLDPKHRQLWIKTIVPLRHTGEYRRPTIGSHTCFDVSARDLDLAHLELIILNFNRRWVQFRRIRYG